MSLTDYSHLVKKADLTKLRPYGDIMDDGVIQLSFTLPVPACPEAREAAIQLCQKMGLDDIKIALMEQVAGPAGNVGVKGFSFFVVYTKMKHAVNFTKIKAVKIESKIMDRDEINEFIKEKIGRKIVILGACTGYDAHTVGIDAIFNMKGFAGDYGLERYEMIDARNLGAQILNEELLRTAVALKADAILVSKIVTQHDIHIKDMKELMELAEKLGIRNALVFVAGGPRVTHQLALECGFDAGFGVGAKPSEVASYVVQKLLAQKLSAKARK